jgi:predicted SAM-dependent methyltransferase
METFTRLNRKTIAETYLRGHGIEIGALHQPVTVPESVQVMYIDRMPTPDIRKQYPELDNHDIVDVDLVDDGEQLSSIRDESQDFVIANHFIEHCQDPIRTMFNLLRVLKQDGILYLAVPDKRYTYDKDRDVTPLEHLVRDHKEGPAWSHRQHFEEWVRQVNKVEDDQEVEASIADLMRMDYSIHYHVWTQAEFFEFLTMLRKSFGLQFDIETFLKHDLEMIFILRKTGPTLLHVDTRLCSNVHILDQYVTSTPHPQNAVDILKGEWVSSFPEPWDGLQAGHIPLHKDSNLAPGIAQLGGIAGKTVVELGPLEGGHTSMLEQAGASSIVAIEANSRAYLKCLVFKEIVGLQRATFLCGDFVAYFQDNETHFDVGVASGVLYHMHNPPQLLALLSKACTALYLWTHYYDHVIMSSNPALKRRFTNSHEASYEGFEHVLYRHEYQPEQLTQVFCGGTRPHSHWMSRNDIVRCLTFFGFENIQIVSEEKHHPSGPCFALTAVRQSP